MRSLPVALAVLAATSLPALADDSIAALATGGLVLEKTDKIALTHEDLFLSEKAVRISYRFRNLTDRDVETTIAFPMPDISGGPEQMIDVADPGHDNFLKFATEVDGRPVESEVEQRAFVTPSDKPETEITQRLKGLRIPLVPTLEATEKAIEALGEPQRRELTEAGILERQEGSDGSVDYFPVWTLKSKFWRKQVFPAGAEVVVQQSYVPALGGLSSLSYGSSNQSPSRRAEYERKFCTDAAFAKGAQALDKRARADGSRTFQAFEKYLSYVITSGGNWAGPIGEFRLVVDKGDPGTLVSFCGNGVRRIGPTSFEMVTRDYVPKRDIDILLLKTLRNDAAGAR